MFQFVINLVTIFALGLTQLSSEIFILGLKASLVMSFVIVASAFSKNWVEKALLVLAGVLAVKFHPGLNLSDVFFVASVSTGVLLAHFLKWQTLISVFAAVAVSTVLNNIIYLNSLIAIEVLINVAATGLFYIALKIIYEEK